MGKEVTSLVKRMGAFLCLFAVLAGFLSVRVAVLSRDGVSINAAAVQSTKTKEISKTRAGIFDRSLKPLVNKDTERKILVFPEIADKTLLLKYCDREKLGELFSGFAPKIFDIGGKIIEGEGIFNFSYPKRYSKNQTAVHIIGYMNFGEGVSGIERSYNEFLLENGERTSVTYYTDGTGRLLLGEEIVLSTDENFEHAGVVLSLDGDIQLAAEKALLSTEKGAAVVLDAQTGEILAAASVPSFDPNEIEEYLDAENAPFVNRAFSAYTVGSTWKLLVVATALESGIPTERRFNCTGKIEVEGRVYKCHWELGHGEIDMKRALEISCNPYFIDLALEVGGEKILDTAKNLGFGAGNSLAEGLSSASGKLPDENSLKAKTALASFAFGQGKLMATPLQLTVLASAIANGGKAVTPKLVLGTYDKNGNYSESPSYVPNPVMSEKTAEILREMMVSVVENGSGKNAKPHSGAAGGKTASAQTGQFDSDGNEIIHAWFLGFYPAEDPRYAIVVLAEGMNSGGDFAAPIFKEICEALAISD